MPPTTQRIDLLEQSVLLERCKDGDPAAWNTLFRRYDRRLYGYALSLCGNAEDAGDIAAHAWLRLFQSLPSFQEGRPLAPWLLRIARNYFIDSYLRCPHRQHSSLESYARWEDSEQERELPAGRTSCPETICFSKETVRLLRKGLQCLPAYQRRPLALLAQGYNYGQIARMMGIPEGTVKSRIGRARRALWSWLEEM